MASNDKDINKSITALSQIAAQDKKDSDEAFESLLAKIEKDKSREWDLYNESDGKELAPLINVIAHYAEHGDMPSYQKLTRLLNLFIDPELDSALHPKISSEEELKRILEKHEQAYIKFPLIKLVMELTSTKSNEHSENANKAYKTLIAFMTENDVELSAQELDLLNPENRKHFLPHPSGPQANDLSRLPYPEMVNAILQNSIAKSKGLDYKFDPEKMEKMKQLSKAMIVETHKEDYLHGLRALIDFYHNFKFPILSEIQHFLYFQADPKRYWFYPNTSLRESLPQNPIFIKLLKLEMKFYPKTQLMVLFFGKLLVDENPHFSGWTLIEKTRGADPGFILQSPDKKRSFYAKYTDNIFEEYFIAKLLGKMGIKMAEPHLVTDDYGNTIFMTLNLTRTYTKPHDSSTKSKSFHTMTEVIDATTAAFGRKTKPSDPSLAEQERSLKNFLETRFSSKKSRISFAKLIILSQAFGLQDLGGHGENIGTLVSERSGKKDDFKVGVVDFVIRVKELSFKDLEKGIEDMRLAPFFRKMSDQLTLEDYAQAVAELEHLKTRSYTSQGFLIQSSRERVVPVEKVIRDVVLDVKKEVQDRMSDKQFSDFCERLEEDQTIMLKNLDKIFSAIKESQKSVAYKDEEQEEQQQPPPQTKRPGSSDKKL